MSSPTSSDDKAPKHADRRRRALLVVAVFLVAAAVDLAQPPGRQLSARILVGVVHAYQWVGHGLVPPGQCRFSPTCSHYAEVVIREHGAVRGGWLTVKRLLRCGPWTPKGTKDPPPKPPE